MPSAASGVSAVVTRVNVARMSGTAAMCWSSVTINRRGSVHAAVTPCPVRAAVTIRLLSSSPAAARPSYELGMQLAKGGERLQRRPEMIELIVDPRRELGEHFAWRDRGCHLCA